MATNNLKCPKLNHEEDVTSFCIKSNCNYTTRFLCQQCQTDDEINHIKDHKDYIISINLLMKDNDKPFRNYPPKKDNDNNISEIIYLFYNNQEDVSPLIEEVEKQF